MGYQFGAIEIPIGVPAADQTLAVLGKIDERAQLVGQNAARSFGQVASPAIEGFTSNAVEGAVAITHAVPRAMNQVGDAAEGLGHRLTHLGVAGSFALTNLANGSEQGVTRLAHSLALFGGAFSPVGLAITTFVAVAGEQLLKWFDKTTEAADKTTEALRKVRDEQRQGKLGTLHSDVNRTEDQLRDLDKEIADKQASINAIKASPYPGIAGGEEQRQKDIKEQTKSLQALQRQRTDLVSLVQSGNKEIVKINDESRKEEERKQKEADDKALAAKKRLLDAGRALEEAGATHVASTRALIRDQNDKAFEAADRDRLKSEEEFYHQLEVDERDYFAKRRSEREKDLEHQREVARGAADLARGISSAISDGFSGGGNGFADGVMKMIGNLFTRIGEAMLLASPILQGIAEALMNPESWLGGGFALAAGGAALIALGAALGASGGHGAGGGHGGARGGGYGSGFNYGQAVVSTITPRYAPNTQGVTAKAPITVNATFFGKRDPQAGRELLEMIAIQQQRGSTAG